MQQTVSVDRLVGQLLGSYRVERLMGQGRLSAVYFAQNTLTNINGALTLFIVPERFSQEARARFMQRFQKEAGALTALQNAHVLPVHEFGEHQGYPYLVTPYMTNGSLADIIKRQGRCDYTEVQDILAQIVDGLEYAHRRGVIHGTLKPSNIVLNDDQDMLVAGFGLMHMLQMRGVEPDNRPYGHLLSIADTFLAAPEYIAPEIVQGQSIDKRSDIYALGIILYELLGGRPPFTGQNPLDVAKMHVEQPVPSLRTLYPDIPMAIISVVNQALDRDPARRFQSASELAEAFAQSAVGASGSTHRLDQKPRTSSSNTDNLPATFATGYSTSSWQLMPPIVTGKVVATNSASARSERSMNTSGHSAAIARTGQTYSRGPQQEVSRSAPPVNQRVPSPPTLVPEAYELPAPMAASYIPQQQQQLASPAPAYQQPVQAYQPPAPVYQQPVQAYQPPAPVYQQPVQAYQPPAPVYQPPVQQPAPVYQPVERESRPEEKNQQWWEQAPQNSFAMGAPEANQWGEAPAWMQPASSKRSLFSKGRTRNNARGNTRSATRGNTRSNTRGRSTSNNTMGRRKVVALLAGGGVAVAAVAVGVKLKSNSQMTTTTATQANTTMPKQPAAKTNAPAANKQPAAKTNAPAANKQPVLTHNGTVIGSRAMAPNTSVVFNNNQDLLIRLPNGTFVAYNRACTHQGVLINYDPATKKMVCPLHGSIFDPAQNAKVLLGPAPTPVAAVPISVNADGTITTMV